MNVKCFLIWEKIILPLEIALPYCCMYFSFCRIFFPFYFYFFNLIIYLFTGELYLFGVFIINIMCLPIPSKTEIVLTYFSSLLIIIRPSHFRHKPIESHRWINRASFFFLAVRFTLTRLLHSSVGWTVPICTASLFFKFCGI